MLAQEQSRIRRRGQAGVGGEGAGRAPGQVPYECEVCGGEFPAGFHSLKGGQ